MDKINPLQYVVDTDPVPEAVIDASGWFAWEYTSYQWNYGQTDNIAWYQAQGWIVYAQASSRRIIGSEPLDHSNDYILYYLKRRRLQSDKALNDLIKDFTAAYNEGRSINDQRYDEIVTIFNSMLDKTEDEINALGMTSTTEYEALLDLLPADFDTFDDDITGLLDDWGTAQRARINLNFDNELADARANLVARGMYNTTVWATTSAGIERRRNEALNDLEDKILARQAALIEGTYDRKLKMRTAVLAAHDRLISIKKDDRFQPLDVRNRVLSAMLGFMERRQDEYPGLEQLGKLAEQLGATSVGSSFTP